MESYKLWLDWCLILKKVTILIINHLSNINLLPVPINKLPVPINKELILSINIKIITQTITINSTILIDSLLLILTNNTHHQINMYQTIITNHNQFNNKEINKLIMKPSLLNKKEDDKFLLLNNNLMLSIKKWKIPTYLKSILLKLKKTIQGLNNSYPIIIILIQQIIKLELIKLI